MYAERFYYDAVYGYDDGLSDAEYGRYEYEAERELDKYTTGIDGVRKLRVAFPTSEYDAEAVRHAVCKIVKTLRDADKYTASVLGSGTEGRIVASVSSGAESMSFVHGGTAVQSVSEGAETRRAALSTIIRDELSGVLDANGVNVLYMGAYPQCIKIR